MEITGSSVAAFDENHHILEIRADEGETICVGQKITVMLMDETYEEHEISSMRVWRENSGSKRGKWVNVDSISNGQYCEVDVFGIKGVVWATNMISPAEIRRMDNMINVMPYKEINGGEESIFDHIDESFKVPKKVILYLQTTEPHLFCMGVYQHPFKDMTLFGPYWYTDGEYYWDRDAWKYVLKYHVTLPQNFIDKVMSDEGTRFLEKCAESDKSLANKIQEIKEHPNESYIVTNNEVDYYEYDEF